MVNLQWWNVVYDPNPSYGTLRPYDATSEYADIFGDQEGLCTKVKVRGSVEMLHLTFKLRYGRGNDKNLHIDFKLLRLALEEKMTTMSFKVMSQKVLATTTIEMPGYTGWHEHSATWYSAKWSSYWKNDDAYWIYALVHQFSNCLTSDNVESMSIKHKIAIAHLNVNTSNLCCFNHL